MGGAQKYLAVLGAGESGTGAAVLAHKKGYKVWVSDKGSIKDKYKEVLSRHGISWEEGKHTEEKILCADEVVKSPGIPDTAPLILLLHKQGTSVISEIEFAGRYSRAKMIGITGSNGKTTTTLLTYSMLLNAGLDVGLAGNVGQSLAMQVAAGDHDYYVLELSSFQLDGMFDFHVDIAMLLNITPDHLDRYDYKLQNYIDSKFRILQNQTPDDAFIYWADDPVIIEELKKRKVLATRYPFTIEEATPLINDLGARMINETIEILTKTKSLTMSVHELALKGKHNTFNSMASGVAGRILELRKETVRGSLTNFENVEHRLEYVGRVHGIRFVNDSKATNINSTWYALESMEHNVIWIAGGVDKGNDYNDLMPLVKDKVKAVICLGKDNSKLMKAFDGQVDHISETEDVNEAVKMAYDLGLPGYTVLMSPACASFDLFQNYEDRGQKFKRAVKML